MQLDSAEGKEIQNVLIKYKSVDDLYPFKPGDVVKLVAAKSGKTFTSDKHQRAWKMFEARPKTGAADPSATDKNFCAYHVPYKAHTYSQAWVDFLAEMIADDTIWNELGAFSG